MMDFEAEGFDRIGRESRRVRLADAGGGDTGDLHA
jgi:hypothetical protein